MDTASNITAFRKKLADHYRQSDKNRKVVMKDNHENYSEPLFTKPLSK